MNIFILTESQWEPEIVSVHLSYEEAEISADKHMNAIPGYTPLRMTIDEYENNGTQPINTWIKDRGSNMWFKQ